MFYGILFWVVQCVNWEDKKYSYCKKWSEMRECFSKHDAQVQKMLKCLIAEFNASLRITLMKNVLCKKNVQVPYHIILMKKMFWGG